MAALDRSAGNLSFVGLRQRAPPRVSSPSAHVGTVDGAVQRKRQAKSKWPRSNGRRTYPLGGRIGPFLERMDLQNPSAGSEARDNLLFGVSLSSTFSTKKRKSAAGVNAGPARPRLSELE